MTGTGNACLALGLSLVAGLASPPAFAHAPQPQAVCTTLPRMGWISADEVENHLRREGYQLLRLRITNEACFLALVTNTGGQQMELRIHPANGALLGPPRRSQPGPTR